MRCYEKMEEKYQKMGTYLLKEHLKLSLSCNQKEPMLFSRRGTRMPEKLVRRKTSRRKPVVSTQILMKTCRICKWTQMPNQRRKKSQQKAQERGRTTTKKTSWHIESMQSSKTSKHHHQIQYFPLQDKSGKPEGKGKAEDCCRGIRSL